MIRINDLARELGVKSVAVLEALPQIGVEERKSHSSGIEDELANRVRVFFSSHRGSAFVKPIAAGQEVRSAEAGPVVNAVPLLTRGQSVSVQESTPPLAAEEAWRSLQPSTQNRILKLPESFSIYARSIVDFDRVIRHFDWTLRDCSLIVDLSSCTRSNFQALALLVQYAWYLTFNGCHVTFRYGGAHSPLTQMLTKMGALEWREILTNDGRDFGNDPAQKTYALRRRSERYKQRQTSDKKLPGRLSAVP